MLDKWQIHLVQPIFTSHGGLKRPLDMNTACVEFIFGTFINQEHGPYWYIKIMPILSLLWVFSECCFSHKLTQIGLLVPNHHISITNGLEIQQVNLPSSFILYICDDCCNIPYGGIYSSVQVQLVDSPAIRGLQYGGPSWGTTASSSS